MDKNFDLGIYEMAGHGEVLPFSWDEKLSAGKFKKK